MTQLLTTTSKVDPFLSTVSYQPTPSGFRGRFELPEFIRSDPSQLVALGWDFFDSKTLRRGAEFAALAAGRVGEPLVRRALTDKYVTPYSRRRDYLRASV